MSACDLVCATRAQTATSGGEDLGPSSEEPEPAGNERAYAACKPLAPADAARGAGAGAAPGRVFYGNDQFYLFFRLHAHLYDRRGPCALPPADSRD